MNERKWEALDFNVASDYTHGSPEYYRTLLRQMVGIPTLLPGEKPNEVNSPKRSDKTDPAKILIGRNMSSNLQKGRQNS